MPVLEDEWDRIAWDVPIHGVSDLDDCSAEPAYVNLKPSRIGSAEAVFDVIETCYDRGVHLYGGGQFELSIGRSHLHALASLYYPDATNDVAPHGYNDPTPRQGLPRSPLSPPTNPVGLQWN
jgi:O-succinylbenzoate synthase